MIFVEKIAAFTGHRDCVYGLVAEKNGRFFYTTSGDGMIVKWDVNNSENGILLAKTPNSIYSVCLDEKSNWLYVGQNFEGIHAIDTHANKELRSIKCTQSYIFDVKLHQNHLFAACGDGTIVVLDINKWVVIHIIICNCTQSARTLHINTQQGHLLAGYSDGFIRVYHLNTFKLLHEWQGHKLSVFSLQSHSHTPYIYSGSRDAHLKRWDAENNYTLSEQVVAHMYAINKISFSPSGAYIATASMDKTIKIWETKGLKLLKVIDKSRYQGHTTSVNNLHWMNENELISVSDDKNVFLWRVRVDS